MRFDGGNYHVLESAQDSSDMSSGKRKLKAVWDHVIPAEDTSKCLCKHCGKEFNFKYKQKVIRVERHMATCHKYRAFAREEEEVEGKSYSLLYAYNTF